MRPDLAPWLTGSPKRNNDASAARLSGKGAPLVKLRYGKRQDTLEAFLGLGRLVLLAGLAAALAVCTGSDPDTHPPAYGPAPRSGRVRYLLGVHPLHNPQKLLAVYGPLVDYLNRALAGRNVSIVLEASRNYAAFEEKVARRKFAFILPNPAQMLEASRQGYTVAAKMVDDDFRGVILVAKDSPIRAPADLKGKIVAYPSPTALAAAMMPQLYLVENGLGSLESTTTFYVGSQESAILCVLSRRCDAGCTWPGPWRLFQREHPDEAAGLRVAWKTPCLPGVPLGVRDDVPESVAAAVTGALLIMSDDPACRPILDAISTMGFERANLETYNPVRIFLARFHAEVRPEGEER